MDELSTTNQPWNSETEKLPKWAHKHKKNTKNAKNVSPVEHARQLQADVHEAILEIGSFLHAKNLREKNKKLLAKFKFREETIKMQLDHQFGSEVDVTSSKVQAEYEKKLSEFSKNAEENYNKAIVAKTLEIQNKRKEKIKQCANESEKIILKDIEKWSIERERCQQQEFGYFKEQSIADFKDYYRQLIAMYHLRFEKHLEDIKIEHAEDYEGLKKLLQKENRGAYDSKQKGLEEKLLAIETAYAVEQTPVHNNNMKRKKKEFLEKLKSKKCDKLNQKDGQLKFCKEKIQSVLRNYTRLVVAAGKGHLLDKNNLFQKYVGPPTASELKQLIHDEESPSIAVINYN